MQRDGATLIVAILGATNMWSDTKHLLAYGFDNYDILKARVADHSKAGIQRRLVAPTDFDGHLTRQ